MYKFVIQHIDTRDILAGDGNWLEVDANGYDTKQNPALFDSQTEAENWFIENNVNMRDENGDDLFEIRNYEVYTDCYIHHDVDIEVDPEQIICSDSDFFITQEKMSDNAEPVSGLHTSFGGNSTLFVLSDRVVLGVASGE